MSKTLGIYVTADHYMDELIELVKAAHAKGIEVVIFFTHIGSKLTVDPRMEQLMDIAKLSVCNVGFEANNLDRETGQKYINEKDFATQARHGEMVDECDRYISW